MCDESKDLIMLDTFLESIKRALIFRYTGIADNKKPEHVWFFIVSLKLSTGCHE